MPGAIWIHVVHQMESELTRWVQDARSIVVEGIIAGEKKTYDCAILLKIYGPADPAVRANCMLCFQVLSLFTNCRYSGESVGGQEIAIEDTSHRCTCAVQGSRSTPTKKANGFQIFSGR